LTGRLLLLLLTKKREGPKNNARLSRCANRDTVVMGRVHGAAIFGARAPACIRTQPGNLRDGAIYRSDRPHVWRDC